MFKTPIRGQRRHFGGGSISKSWNTVVSYVCAKYGAFFTKCTILMLIRSTSMEAMCHEWKERAPIFYAFLMTIALSNGTKDSSWLPSIALAGSILLKQRSRHMNGTATFLAIAFKTTSTEVSMKGFRYSLENSLTYMFPGKRNYFYVG